MKHEAKINRPARYINKKYQTSKLSISAVICETHLTREEISTYRSMGMLVTFTPKQVAKLICTHL